MLWDEKEARLFVSAGAPNPVHVLFDCPVSDENLLLRSQYKSILRLVSGREVLCPSISSGYKRLLTL